MNQYSKNDSTTQSDLQIQHNPDQTTNDIFHRTRTINFILCMETQRTRIPKVILRKNDGTGGINLPDFRLYYKAIVIKTVWYWHKYRNMDQWNKIRRPEINPCTYAHVIFDKGCTDIQQRKDSPFKTCCWEKWSTMCKRMKLEQFLTPYIKINSKWIEDLNVRPETMKLLRARHRQNTLWHKLWQDPLWLTSQTSVQLLSHIWLFVNPWTAVRQASLFVTDSRSLLKLMPLSRWCHPTISFSVVSFSSSLQSFPASGVFSNKSALCIRWPKYWSFSFSISPSNEYSGLISFRADWMDLLAVQGTLKSLLQHHSSKVSILLHSSFFIVQLSHSYILLEKP